MEYRCTLGRVEVGWRGVEPDDLSLLCIIIHWSGGGGGRSLEVCSKGGRGSCSTSWCVSSFRRILLEFRPMLTIAEHPLTHISPPHPPPPLFFLHPPRGNLYVLFCFFTFFYAWARLRTSHFKKLVESWGITNCVWMQRLIPAKHKHKCSEKKNTAKLIQN